MTIVPVGPGQWQVWDKGQRIAVGTDIAGVLFCGYCLTGSCKHVGAVKAMSQDSAKVVVQLP